MKRAARPHPASVRFRHAQISRDVKQAFFFVSLRIRFRHAQISRDVKLPKRVVRKRTQNQIVLESHQYLIKRKRRPFADVFTQSLIDTIVSLAANGHFAIAL